MIFPHKKGFLRALIQQNSHVIVTFSRWDFLMCKELSKCNVMTILELVPHRSLCNKKVYTCFWRMFYCNKTILCYLIFHCLNLFHPFLFFRITAIWYIKFCHPTNMIIINNVFDKIYMLITGGAFAQLWLIIYKNIVSATINLPLFQLAKKKTMSFRIMQNYKNIRNELYCWIVILSNEVVNENRVVYFGNSTKIFIAKNLYIRLSYIDQNYDIFSFS